MRVTIAIYEGVDLLDVGGPYEVFLTASRLVSRTDGDPPFEVLTVGAGPAQAYGGLGLQPHTTFAELGAVDVLVIPGAIAIDEVRLHPDVRSSLATVAEEAAVVASVCTGAFLMADLGLLPPSWTTHWEDIPELTAEGYGGGDETVRWVDSGRVVTSGGLSSGIAMALHLVDRFCGRDLAMQTARQIDYPWDPSGARAGTLGPTQADQAL